MPWFYAEYFLVKRIVSHHPDFFGFTRADLIAHVRALSVRESVRESVGVDRLLNRFYSQTFSLSQNELCYQNWVEAIEQSKVARALSLLRVPSPAVTFSILVPMYNSRPDFLQACIESVLGQGYPFWQLCLVDDGSSAREHIAVVERFAKQDARICFVARAVNGHICAASNEALALARGEFCLLELAFYQHDW
jgi:hypothetical protein